jgi:hypothetical protein
MVKITIKTPSQQQPLTLDIDPAVTSTIALLKEKVAEKTESSAANVKLIHKGKILKD